MRTNIGRRRREKREDRRENRKVGKDFTSLETNSIDGKLSAIARI